MVTSQKLTKHVRDAVVLDNLKESKCDGGVSQDSKHDGDSNIRDDDVP